MPSFPEPPPRAAPPGTVSPRPVVLVATGHYLPGFRAGGPIHSIANLVDHLQDEFDFRILCGDRDLGDERAYPGLQADRWVRVGPALVHYTSPANQGARAVTRLIAETPHDLLYLNSFFSPRFTIVPLLARRLGRVAPRPTVLAPRGEFSAGALALKALKKRSYLAAGRAAGLFRGLIWQASSEFEAGDIRAVIGPQARVHVACDLPAPAGAPCPAHRPRQPGEPLRLVFISRLSPKKNLDYALKVLAQLRVPVRFTIHGPAEDADYVALCRRLAGEVGPHVAVAWAGPLRPEQVAATFAAHDLFFFPTRGENYGHVIAESLAAGTPVLIADTTPWRGLAQAGVGDDLPLSDPAAFAARIAAMADEPVEMAPARRARAAAYVRQSARRQDDILANRNLFRLALAEGE
ncbi:glycosyltransferase family 4 protein [Ancylobacter sp. IITR112]|uniref:glycosyltransferase family 4 protein n=1 Tax=Ancylobacter sp. IITR112 TaxID=3138073 RepID=UPI00352B05AB